MTLEFDPTTVRKTDIRRMMKDWKQRTKTDEEKKLTAQEEHTKRMNSIQAKLKSGKKLSAKEMQYLQEHDMIAYIHALRVQHSRKQLTESLKHAKSKQQAKNIISNAMAQIDKDDPDREALMAAICDIGEKFMKSAAYQQLPETASEDDEDKENNFEDTCENDEDESFDMAG